MSGRSMRKFFSRKGNVTIVITVVVLISVSIWMNPKQSPSQIRDEPFASPAIPKDEAEALIHQASENYFFHEFAKGAENYRKAILVYENRNELTKAARTYESLGDLYKFANEPREAQIQYEEAARYHERINNPVGQARALKLLGDMMVLWKKEDQAEVAYRKGLSVTVGGDPNIVLANVQEALGQLLWKQKKQDEAIVLFTQARNTFKDLGNGFGVSHMTSVLDRLQGKPKDLHGHAVRGNPPPQ